MRNFYLFIFIFLFITFKKTSAQKISCGYGHSIFLCIDGTVKSSGWNEEGALGNGTLVSDSIPIQVSSMSGIIDVSAGSRHSIFLKNDGTVWGCGINGGFGDTTTNSFITPPIQIPSLSAITKISAGNAYSIFLKNDSTVLSCGWNPYGNLGDSSFIPKVAPTQVYGLKKILDISAGHADMHSLFLKEDGTVWGCGYNGDGELGDSTRINRIIPIQIPSFSGIINISAGGYHSLFLKNDGTVWACGDNYYGQLGIGSNIPFDTVPVLINSLSNITAIAAGVYHSLFLKNDSTVWACGNNGSGQFGNGTTSAYQNTPIQIASLSSIIAIATEESHSLFLKSDGTVWACGWNFYGELGDSSTIQKLTPIQVTNLCFVGAGLEEENLENNISIFPNPSSDFISVTYKSKTKNSQIEIIDLMGRQVKTGQMQSQIEISNLQNGFYILKIKDGDLMLSKQFIKN